MKRVTVIFSALMVCQAGLWASEAPPSFALAQLDYGAVIETAPEPGAAAPAARGPQAGWQKKLVNNNKPEKEPLTGSALPEGVTYDPASCGAAAEYFINFTQKTGGVQGARAEMKLSFDYLCSYSDGGRHISGIKVKAEKASALPLKVISVTAELPPTSVANCALPGEPVTACADLVLSFSISPMAGSWEYYSEIYTLRGDGTISSRAGAVLQPGSVEEITR